jgi:serine/threonine protein kinase
VNESQVFTNALKLASASERAAYLDEACAGKAELRAAVEALLHAHADDPGFLEQPAGSLWGTVDGPAAPALEERLALAGGMEVSGMVLAGRYKLLQLIGEGGMGAVWLAEQIQPVQRKVALKIIKAGMDSRQVLARFEAERQALALMDHPNIAKVLDGGTTKERDEGGGMRDERSKDGSASSLIPHPSSLRAGRPFFVMELVKGQPITKYCDDQRLTPRERLELFIAVCQAIQHAHQKAIIHRDIKPSNVLVAPYDGKPVVKVIDFGVAKATGQALTEKTLFTEFGAVIGTLEYMSPEQAELNNQDIDTRSDIYSLGVLLYELLTGTTPLDRARLKKTPFTELLRKIREEEPPKPSTRLSEAKETLPAISAQRQMEPAKLTKLVKGELDWIVMKALEKDRNRRYESANAVAQDVQRYLADEAVQACSPSAGYRFRKFARRNKARFLTGSVVVLAVILGVIGLAVNNWMVTREKAQKESALANALREKDRADLNLARAERAVEQYLQIVKDPKLKTTDLQALRKQLLATAIPFLEEFVRQEGDDRRLIMDRAWALLQLAGVRAGMGQTEAALADYEQARAGWARLASDLPNVARPRQSLAQVDNDSGVLLADLGQMEKAEAAYRRAMTIEEQLIADFPTVGAYRSSLANTLNNLANLDGKRGNLEEQQKLIERALVHQQAAVRTRPKSSAFRQSLGNHQHNLGNVFVNMHKWEEAARAYESARTTFHALIADFGADPEHRDGLATTLTALGDVACEQGKFPEAEKAYREALKTQEQLAADFTSVPRYRVRLAGSYHNLGQMLSELGKFDEADTAFHRALAIRRELANGFPNVPDNWRCLAQSQDALGMLWARQRKWAKAEAAQREALAAGEKLVKLCPTVPEYAVDLGSTQVNVGLREADRGEFKNALSWLDKAVATFESVPAGGKKTGTFRRFLGNAHSARAEVLMRLGRHAEALGDWEKVLRLDVQGDRRHMRMQRALTLAYLKEHVRATVEADAVARIQGLPAYLLHDAASVHAVAAATVRDQADLSEKYAARAVALLRRAFEKNYQAVADEVREGKHLDLLRSREDFRRLLKDFQARDSGPGDKNPQGEKKRSPE